MNTQQAYDRWAEQYDTNVNKTRDLEGLSLREILAGRNFRKGLEIGCGTGKNTEFLHSICGSVTAVDLSEEMLAKAKAKVIAPNVRFVQADINDSWDFTSDTFDLITFSLILEHIENLDAVFSKVSHIAETRALLYIGELHPFKQYTGSKAKFETERGTEIVPCFNHHISDFIAAAKNHGFYISDIKEYFDDKTNQGIPRILTLLFTRS